MQNTTTNPETLTTVPTGNGEPDLLRDAEGRAYWADGERVTAEECATEDADVLVDCIERNDLTVLDNDGGEMTFQAGRPEPAS